LWSAFPQANEHAGIGSVQTSGNSNGAEKVRHGSDTAKSAQRARPAGLQRTLKSGLPATTVTKVKKMIARTTPHRESRRRTCMRIIAAARSLYAAATQRAGRSSRQTTMTALTTFQIRASSLQLRPHMKGLILATAITFAPFIIPAHASSFTGELLAYACKGNVPGMKMEQDTEQKIGFCNAYITGWDDARFAFLKGTTTFCPPKLTYKDMSVVFFDYLAAHSEARQLPAAEALMLAFKDKWPCH
jgi:hypothetical protein